MPDRRTLSFPLSPLGVVLRRLERTRLEHVSPLAWLVSSGLLSVALRALHARSFRVIDGRRQIGF